MALKKKGIQTFEDNVKCEYTFTWNIKKFSNNFDSLESKEISLSPMCNSSWKIIIKYSNDTELLNLGMQRTDKNAHNVFVNSAFSFRNTKGTPYARRTLKASFSWAEESKFCENPFRKPVNTNGVKNDAGAQFQLCSDDILVMEGTISTISCCLRNVPMEKSLSELHRALKMSLDEKLFADINFVIGDDVVPANKFMLAARSPVFRRMLESNMKENDDNSIKLTDIEKSVLENFLTFIYTGSIGDYDPHMIIQLYSVSDKYDVQSLREVCSSALSVDLSEKSVCNILSLADLHSDKQLLDKAFRYLCDHFDLIEPTEEWDKFVTCNTVLAAKIVRKVASSAREF